VGVPPGARELSVPVSPSGIAMETSGALRFLENPDGHCPCCTTPVGPVAPCGTRCDTPDVAPACVQDEGSPRLVISGLNHTTFDLAVYGSQGESPHRHARLASGCWPGFARRDSYPLGSNERFPISSLFLLSQAFLTQGHHTQPKGEELSMVAPDSFALTRDRPHRVGRHSESQSRPRCWSNWNFSFGMLSFKSSASQ
jgi:hypothetical protein